ncbi:hypothetical protein C8Q77DRAFT_1158778 [Trametes polyzona]|nr:hypothetical protein C8Q77DRAFT_1158778 [Trametes polyzona]
MASTLLHMPRPTVKRASHTWPGDATRRSHFEDFIREIGADPESMHLCCKGTSPHPHAHPHTHAHAHAHAHLRQGSTPSLASKARSSTDKARASPEGTGRRAATHDGQSRPSSIRGRTMSTPRLAGSIVPKSPALSYIDLENHDATPSYNHLSSARDALLTAVGGSPIDERPSRSPTRTFFRDRAPVSSSPDSETSPSRFHSSSSSPGHGSHHRSRTQSSARSPSRSPSIDSLDTASSSEAPATPRTHSVLVHELPSLDDLERASRFRVESTCVNCRRAGSNFPSCAKCGERWCSRECRLQAQRGSPAGTHACHARAASA